ncbi:MAG: citrate synthase, partial [Candidatus Bathyarchaeia archaeon]
MSKNGSSKGLEDVIVAPSGLCFIDGINGKLLYSGIDIHELAAKSSFEEIAYLLWFGNLPKPSELDQLNQNLVSNRNVPNDILSLIKSTPKESDPMDVLRTSVSALSFHDTKRLDNTRDANLTKALQLTAKMPTILAAFQRIRSGKPPISPRQDLSHAGNFLYMLKGEPPEKSIEHAFDVCLILHADHEMNASTFAARVTASTYSDMYSAITSAIGALNGPLHGGANRQVMLMLLEIKEPTGAQSYIKTKLTENRKIPGFGHRVYKTVDPRATILREISKEMGRKSGETQWYEISRKIEEIMTVERKIYPNVDFYSATTYYGMGIPLDLFTSIFACSRIVGWSANLLEQYADNRIIRPRSEYVGPKDRR